jgi:nucleotide-binding universal stress UspA family protein
MSGVSHILVATDLTDRSERALARGLQLWRDLHADRLTVLHVIGQGLPAELEAQQQTAAQAFLAARLAKAPGARGSLAPSVSVCSGIAFSTIIGEAIARKAGLVVIGAPGRHRYSDTFMGTTAELHSSAGTCSRQDAVV